MAQPKMRADVRIALIVAGLLIGLGLVVGNDMLAVVLTPVVFLILAYVMFQIPIRHSMMALMFLALALPFPADCTPSEWRAPFHMLGAILLTHLNTLIRNTVPGLSFCSFSLMDLSLATLGVVALVRRMSGSKIDRAGRIATPKPLVRLAYVSLGGTLYVWISGMLRGGDFGMSLWQLDKVMYLPVVFLLFQHSLRGPEDHPALMRVVLAAAAYKALLAVYIINNVTGYDHGEGDTSLEYATSHSDSMLFAGAFVLILALVFERVGKRARWLAVVLLPVLAAGVVANHRRMAWVQVGLVFLTVYLISRDNPFKRKMRKILWVSSPMIALYVLVGWSSTSSVFKPVQTIRSVVDAQSDGSSFWRELENFDLISTIRLHPVLGVGYGNKYEEVVELPHVIYDLERYVPHNGLLGLWCYCGYFGYTALTTLWIAAVYFAMRAYYVAKDPTYRAAALVSFGAVLIYLMQCWGDLGLGSWIGVYTVAPAIAVAGKLAKSVGAWGSGRPKRAAVGKGPPPVAGTAEQAA